jgi:hypothetical protein
MNASADTVSHGAPSLLGRDAARASETFGLLWVIPSV